MYNLTNLTGSGTVYDIVVFANNSTSQVLMGLFMLSIFFIMLMVLKRYEMKNALLVSSYACFLLSAMLGFAHMMNFLFTLGFLLIAGFMTLYVFTVQE